MKIFAAPALAALLLVAGPAAAAEEGDTTAAATEEEGSVTLVLDAEVGVFWNYYFRGVYLFKDVLYLQPSLTIGANTPYGTFSANFWAGIPFSKRDELEAVRDEVDFTLQWSNTFLDMLDVGVGVVSYTNLHVPFHTEEVWATVDASLPLGLVAGCGLWGDFTEFKGIYYKVYVGWSTSFAEIVSLSVDVFHGGAKYKDVPFSAVEAVGADLEISVDVGYGLSVGALGIFAYNPDNEENKALWTAGAKVAYSYE